MRIEVHIERLVLDGVDGADRTAVAAALETRLTALLTERGLPPGLARAGARSHVDAGTLPASGTEPGRRSQGTALGTAVAQRVYGALGAAPGGRRGP
jgi:hypothetical protein